MTEVPTRLLRTALRRADDTSPDCVDAGTLAAWADDSLTRDERAAVENHASGCARCQAMLAAMVRTEATTTHAAPSTENRLRRLFGMRWLVPIAAAAVVVAVWIAVPARRERQVAAPSAAVQPAPESTQALGAAAPSAALPPSTGAGDRLRQREMRQDRSREKAASKATVLAPEPAAAPIADSAAATPLPPAPSPASPTAAPTSAPSAARSGTTSELAEPQARRATALSAAQDFARRVTSPATTIVSSDAAARWRIVAPATVDRSTDGGATWESQPTGVAVMLSAGAAPSRDVCWMVGPRGTVVLSTDGRLWRRVSFPEAVDLVGVRASDAVNATLTARDGRLFVTRDGGATWRSR